MKDKHFLHDQIKKKKSMLCVGLDPELDKLPVEFHMQAEPLFHFCNTIIENTSEFAVAYKLNVAFFESQGPKGWSQFEKVIKKIPEDCLIIADAKRADIGNTSQQYARYYFEELGVDAITLHPYMGVDSLEPFLKYRNKWSIILSLTSNPGSLDFEMQKLENGSSLYEKVISIFLQTDYQDNLMFVCGATHPEKFKSIRKICPDHFLLVPGVGAQGGDLRTIIEYGKNNSGGLLINVSRGIIQNNNRVEFHHGVQQNARFYQKEMASCIGL